MNQEKVYGKEESFVGYISDTGLIYSIPNIIERKISPNYQQNNSINTQSNEIARHFSKDEDNKYKSEYSALIAIGEK